MGRAWLASLELPAVSREVIEDDLALIDALQQPTGAPVALGKLRDHRGHQVVESGRVPGGRLVLVTCQLRAGLPSSHVWGVGTASVCASSSREWMPSFW